MFDFLFFVSSRSIFWICFSSLMTEFGIVVNKPKFNIFEIAENLKIVIFPSKVSFLICYNLITLIMFLIESQKLKLSCSFLLQELCTPKIFMVFQVRSTFLYHRVPCLHFSVCLFLQFHIYIHQDAVRKTWKNYHELKHCIEILMLKYFYTMNVIIGKLL